MPDADRVGHGAGGEHVAGGVERERERVARREARSSRWPRRRGGTARRSRCAGRRGRSSPHASDQHTTCMSSRAHCVTARRNSPTCLSARGAPTSPMRMPVGASPRRASASARVDRGRPPATGRRSGRAGSPRAGSRAGTGSGRASGRGPRPSGGSRRRRCRPSAGRSGRTRSGRCSWGVRLCAVHTTGMPRSPRRAMSRSCTARSSKPNHSGQCRCSSSTSPRSPVRSACTPIGAGSSSTRSAIGVYSSRSYQWPYAVEATRSFGVTRARRRTRSTGSTSSWCTAARPEYGRRPLVQPVDDDPGRRVRARRRSSSTCSGARGRLGHRRPRCPRRGRRPSRSCSTTRVRRSTVYVVVQRAGDRFRRARRRGPGP